MKPALEPETDPQRRFEILEGRHENPLFVTFVKPKLEAIIAESTAVAVDKLAKGKARREAREKLALAKELLAEYDTREGQLRKQLGLVPALQIDPGYFSVGRFHGTASKADAKDGPADISNSGA